MTFYSTVGVLAGAYRGRDVAKRSLLTHTGVGSDPNFDEPDEVLCRRVPPEHCTAGGVDVDAPPTCPLCLERDPRFGGTYRPRRNGYPYTVGGDGYTSLHNATMESKRTGLPILDEAGNVVEGAFVRGTISPQRMRKYLERKAAYEAQERAKKPRRNGTWTEWRSIPDHPHFPGLRLRTLTEDHDLADERGRRIGGLATLDSWNWKGPPGIRVWAVVTRDGVPHGPSSASKIFDDEESATRHAQRLLAEQRKRYEKKYGARPNGSDQLSRAENLYETFHQFEHTKVGSMPSLRIPSRVNHVGEAKVMYYASDKLNPETSEDEGWIHYFHEHEGDVKFCVTDDADGDIVDVPNFIRDPDIALVRIGDCEGFQYEDFDGNVVEAEGTGRLPEWYATSNGKALLVVQDKRRVIAILWGGDLDVKAEGVVG
jgi:hypothetical protein